MEVGNTALIVQGLEGTTILSLYMPLPTSLVCCVVHLSPAKLDTILSSQASGDQGPFAVALSWTLCVVSGIVIALRFWARILGRTVGLDD